ncbi:MAG: hypothetical protein LC804_03805 [Acidobacteria bacterium]|nr:hypothetical protein [Acidobacteriota bacterium]
MSYRVLLVFLAILLSGSTAWADSYRSQQPRRHFVMLSADWLYTQPLHFAEHPLEDLVGTEVASAQREDFEYRTRDGAIAIDVLEFKRRGRGASVTVFPLGLSQGAALALRGSYEQLPIIRIVFTGVGSPAPYELTNARAFDAGLGVYVADRATGWGLGSHAFATAGIGRIRSDLGDGRRYFAEGGGGLTSGPLGVELSVKFAWNAFSEPVEHRFLTIPIAVRGTLTF